jgi:anti-anti-sigma factor
LGYIDSSGLGLLLAMSKEYGAMGGQLVLVTNEFVDKILGMAKIDRVFATASSLADAVEIIDARATSPAAYNTLE